MSANDAFFSSGFLTFIPPGANPTPFQIARLRDCSLKMAKDTKALEVDRVLPIDKAWAGLSLKLTAKNAEWRADAIAAVFAGFATQSTGRMIGVDREPATIPTNPYTVVAANVTGHVDLGVEDVTASIAAGHRVFLKRVASAPTTGQYSVSAGSYVFAAADQGHNVMLRYYYSNAGGATLTLKNIAPRLDPSFTCTVFNTNAAGKDYGFSFVNAHVDSLGLAFKLKDWNEQDVEVDIIGDDNDNVGSIYKAEN